MIKKLFFFFVLSSTFVYAQTINLAVSANVSYAMQEIKKEFKKLYPDIKVKVIIGSSGKLTAQIKHGAPYDIFMSANMKYPQSLYENALTLSKPYVYAQGSLSYLSATQRDFSQGLNILTSNEISKIAIANPKIAPYGKASFQALKNFGILEDVKKKIVYAESATQTLSFTIAAVDIGFIASSALYSPKLAKYKRGVNYMDVDTSLYTPIKQGIVMLARAKNNKSAHAFYDFILGVKAKQIFVSYGYKVL